MSQGFARMDERIDEVVDGVNRETAKILESLEEAYDRIRALERSVTKLAEASGVDLVEAEIVE